MSGRIAARLAELGITLPPVPRPAGTYVPYVRSGALVFLAGQGPRRADGSFASGQVGREVSVAEAYGHARLVGLALIAVLAQAADGDLDRVVRIVKLFGMVNAAPGFGEHPEVINGASDLFVEVFGEAGRHARSAVGMGSLPRSITVEIEAVAELG